MIFNQWRIYSVLKFLEKSMGNINSNIFYKKNCTIQSQKKFKLQISMMKVEKKLYKYKYGQFKFFLTFFQFFLRFIKSLLIKIQTSSLLHFEEKINIFHKIEKNRFFDFQTKMILNMPFSIVLVLFQWCNFGLTIFYLASSSLSCQIFLPSKPNICCISDFWANKAQK